MFPKAGGVRDNRCIVAVACIVIATNHGIVADVSTLNGLMCQAVRPCVPLVSDRYALEVARASFHNPCP